MTIPQWKQISGRVTDAMREFTRPFVTPLGTETPREVRLIGTGSYVICDGRCLLLTCEHVARNQPIHYRFYGSDEIFAHRGAWRMDPHPYDAACAPIGNQAWHAVAHRALPVPFAKFTDIHHPHQKEELLFFRGYAGENARYAFDIHQTNGTGYCTQEVANSGDSQNFEMSWDPQWIEFTTGTSADVRAEIKKENPGGFSGSLVWNTRFLETEATGKQWSPEDAVVTGLLRRWDTATKTLLVWRVEHLRTWMSLSL